jgi:hypothetical protein
MKSGLMTTQHKKFDLQLYRVKKSNNLLPIYILRARIKVIVSTFELLVKDQLPKLTNVVTAAGPLDDSPPVFPGVPDKLDKLRRTVIQGYFLTIANLNASELVVSVVFTFSSSEPLDDILGILDVSGVSKNKILNFDDRDIFEPKKKVRFTFSIEGSAIVKLLLQPDIITKNLLETKDFEVRGYTELFVSAFSSDVETAFLQVSAEHRGTFFKSLEDNEETMLDSLAYSLPVPNGGFFELKI